MTNELADDNARNAASYMVSEYGDKAVEEAEKGLHFAHQAKNKEAVEAFTAILICLKSLQ